jgi:hypothetical protein
LQIVNCKLQIGLFSKSTIYNLQLGGWKRKEEGAAFAGLALNPDPAAMGFDDQLTERQTQAAPATPLADLPELGEDLLLILRRDPDSPVANSDRHKASP